MTRMAIRVQNGDVSRLSSLSRTSGLRGRKQQLVRDVIWGTAIDLFAKTGFEDTTIDEIAAAAGVSTRTFFRYFASKRDLMGQGMIRYRTLLTEAVASAARGLPPLEVVRHSVAHVAADVASTPRIRQVIQIATSSVAAREAQLSRRAEVEDGLAQAFAARLRARSRDELQPRLLAGLMLSMLDVTFRVWSRGHGSIGDTVEDTFAFLRTVVSVDPAKTPARARARAAKRRQ
jgi:AcrR family transcriptional regulator